MRFIHAAVSLDPPIGIVQQMAQEAQAAAALGLDWTVWLCRATDLPPAVRRLPHVLRGSLLRILFFARLMRLRLGGSRIVLRHSHGDPFEFFASFLLGDYWTVHHTLEEAELAVSDHRLAPLLLRLERTLGRRTVTRARGIICVTGQIASYELGRLPSRSSRQALIYPNGILYEDTAGSPEDRRGEEVEIVFVASQFFAWHGLDRLLASMRTSRAGIRLHLVGAVSATLLNDVGRDPRIHVHGLLDPPRLTAVIGRSWVGLSSFGLDRKGMTEACTLKVREYLQAGLPVYAGHRDAALPEDFAYFRVGAADIDAITAFARSTRAVARRTVAEAARPFIDKRMLLQRLHAALSNATSDVTAAGL
jgi:hypothetical protein